MVPESDPNIALINDKIQNLKDNVQRISAERGNLQVEFKKVQDLRTAKFLEFFDQVAKQVEDIYTALTTKDSSLNQGGRAQLFLEDRQNPFERSIHYTP